MTTNETICQSAPQGKKNIKKLVVATSIGNALEWYDIAVYGYFATFLSHVFFPTENPNISLLLTFGTFGISFLIRPIGGIVLGIYADRVGRKASLMLSISLMMVGTFMITFMPGYDTIGLAAPIGILFARLIQGFSAGGEFASSTSFLVEHAPKQRGFIASWQFASQGFSTLLASAFGVGLGLLMPPDILQSWGWRIPFAFGLLVGPIGIYIRKNLEDALGEPPAAKHEASPLLQMLQNYKLAVILSIGALAISTAVNYLIVYMPTYAVKTLGLSQSVGYTATFIGGLVLTIVSPIAGLISDKVGRVRHMLTICIIMLFFLFPAFMILTRSPTPTSIILIVFGLTFLKALYYGPLAALMSELFPAHTRATGLGFSYNIGVTIFGGMGPMIMAFMGGIALFGDLAPGYYLTIICLFSLVTLLITSNYLTKNRYE